MPSYCDCERPQAPSDPRFAGRGRCRCGKLLNPAWVSAAQVGPFYDGLAEGLFPYSSASRALVVPDEWHTFRAEAESRELAGREHFGFQYLTRKNRKDAREEAADGANYFLFDQLQEVRRNGTDRHVALVLEGAKHFYRAYRTALELGRVR